MSDLVGIPEDRFFFATRPNSSKIKLLLTDRSSFILLFRFLFHRLTDKKIEGKTNKNIKMKLGFQNRLLSNPRTKRDGSIGIKHRTDAKSDEILACCKCKIVQQVRQNSKSAICLFEGKRPR